MKLVAFFSFLLIPSISLAAGPAAMKVCVAANGAVTAKTKCSKAEKQLNTSGLVGAQGFQGPAGPQGPQGVQGPQGPAGVGGINKNSCHLRNTDVTSSGFATADSVCLVGEVFMSAGCRVLNGSAYAVGTQLRTAIGTVDQVAGVTCVFFDSFNTGQPYTAQAQAWCCAAQ